jgi:Formamidopyrimidine-DNA glycosylase H2TH domain
MPNTIQPSASHWIRREAPVWDCPHSCQHAYRLQWKAAKAHRLVSRLFPAELYERLSSKLGPDPLREDADKEELWLRMRASKKPVGLILMDQSFVAGLGNIYRAEVLYKVRSTQPEIIPHGWTAIAPFQTGS